MKELLDYYKLLKVAELEGDLSKAVSAGNPSKIKAVYKMLAEAKVVLHTAQSKQK
jgi:hypothetical protein